MSISPLNDLAVIVPLDLSAMEISKPEGFGIKVKADTPEEALRWKVIAVGPGVYSQHGDTIPNPLHVGDVIVIANVPSHDLRESWSKLTELLDGSKYMLVRAFSNDPMIIRITPDR